MIILLMNKFKPNQAKGFDEVKDLVRGTIIADVSEFKEAYSHFKNMPEVKVVNIKEKLDKL